ncbi:hypothetical protein GCM10008915_67410 [Bifidobacterium pullorum subsp. gallinarum]
MGNPWSAFCFTETRMEANEGANTEVFSGKSYYLDWTGMMFKFFGNTRNIDYMQQPRYI